MAHGPDEAALTLLRRRDPRGFDLVYGAYAARVRSFVLRLSGRADVADDLLQHTFLRLAERGPDLRADSDLRAWLFTVARNAYLGQVRAQRVAVDAAALESLASPADDVEARLALGDVEHALSRLRLEDRELLLLVGVEGMEPVQVAAMLGVDAATVRQRLARARSRLSCELERRSTSGDSPKKATVQ
ncbi:MAG: RNA polymerase sigma factor [Polyangiaceae bacterium]|jgi:RNA polymerase sigma-70 factor (ECF subfamily)